MRDSSGVRCLKGQTGKPRELKDSEDQDTSNHIHEANDDEGNYRWDSFVDNSVNNAGEFQESGSSWHGPPTRVI